MSDVTRPWASTANLCTATTKSGAPCRGYAGAGSALCFWHDPQRATDRAQARAAGGRARHARRLATHAGDPDALELQTIADWLALLARSARDLLTLENSIGRARACAYLASVAIRALTEDEFEARLTALENPPNEGDRHAEEPMGSTT